MLIDRTVISAVISGVFLVALHVTFLASPFFCTQTAMSSMTLDGTSRAFDSICRCDRITLLLFILNWIVDQTPGRRE
jgi:hypothetical protein